MLVECQEHIESVLARADATRDTATVDVRVITSVAGGGRTALLAAAADEARERGWTVLSAGGSAQLRSMPLAGLVELLESGPVPAQVVDTVRDALAELVGRGLVDDGICSASALLIGTVHRALEQLPAPLLLCLDDVHSLDASSLHVVGGVLRRRRSGALTLAVTVASTGDGGAGEAFLAELVRHSDYRHVELPLLSTDAVSALLAESVGTAPSAAITTAVHEASGGNPLLVRALIADALDGTDPSRIAAGGEIFRHAAVALLADLPAELRRVATAIGVLGAGCCVSDVAALSELAVDEVESNAQALCRTGLVTAELTFRSEAVRAGAVALRDPAERRSLHERAAHALHERGATALEVAGHLLAAGQASEPWTVRVLLDAARHAESLDSTDLAVSALDLAIRADGDTERAARSLLSLTRLEWRTEPCAAARHLPDLVAAARRGHLDPADLVVVARWSLWLGERAQAHELLEAVLSAPGGSLEEIPAVRAELVALRTWFPEDLDACAATTLDEVRRLPAPLLADARICATIAAHALARGARAEDVLVRTEQVLADCELGDATLPTILCAVRTLILADRHERADAWLDLFLRAAQDRGAVTWEALLSALRGEAALRRGDLPAAARWSEHAIDALSARSWGVLVGWPYAVRIEALVAMSRLDDALALARQIVPDEMFETRYGLRYLQARGRLYLAADRLHAARADFARCEDRAARWNVAVSDQQLWRIGLAGVYLRMTMVREARALVADLVPAPQAQQPRVRGEFLRVIAATSDPRRRPAVLREAVDLLHAAGARVELAMALAELSRAYTALGEYHPAKLMARRALEVALECGAEVSCRRVLGREAGADLGRLPNGSECDAAADLLSDAERRVAELAVVGHTNREISAKLFITVSTVEQHLTRVYRKLDVTRRVDLPLRLRGPVDAELTLAASA